MRKQRSLKRIGRAAVLVSAILLSCPGVLATSTAVDQPPRICDITVELVSHSQVRISWKEGTPPFLVLRGDREDFTTGEVRLLGSNVAGREFRDHIEIGKRYWYQVADLNSPPLLFGMEPSDPHAGDLLTILGVGFATDCKDNHIIQGGKFDAMPVLRCSLTSLEVEIPIYALSDEIMVMTPRGLGRFDSALMDCDLMPVGPVTWVDATDAR